MSLLTIDEIYKATEEIHSGLPFEVPAEQILASIERSFQQQDQAHAQNFLNFVVEEFDYFKQCKNIFDRVKLLSSTLMNSDQLASKIVGFTALTKLWLHCPDTPQVTDFVTFLYKTARESEQPHIRSICSECLLEIWTARPEAVPYNAEDMIDAANQNLAPNAFGGLALSMGGPNDKIAEFFNKRWWSLSPFETVLFTPHYKPEHVAVPNDPLLLHAAMSAKTVPKEAALAMINSPLAAYGIPSVLYGFPDNYELTGAELFAPYDSREQIAAKSQLLAGTLDSIESNPILADFVNQNPESSIVSAVFDIAARLTPADLFVFYRKYFPSSEQFDDHWIDLYHTQNDNVRHTLRSFMSEFSTRRASQNTLLSSNEKLPSLNLISSIKDESLLPFLEKFVNDEYTETGVLARQKLSEFTESEVAKKILSTKQVATIPEPKQLGKCFSIVNRTVSTTDKTKTHISMSIESHLDARQPIYGVCFTISNPEFFENDGETIVPSMTSACQVQFDMVPKKAGKCKLSMTCTYTTAAGETVMTTLTGDSMLDIYPVEFMSTSSQPFADVWGQGEESRMSIPMKFQSFVSAINTTVFCASDDMEENAIQTTVVTPDGHNIAVRAIGNGASTTVQFKAPTLQILVLVDDFLRALAHP